MTMTKTEKLHPLEAKYEEERQSGKAEIEKLSSTIRDIQSDKQALDLVHNAVQENLHAVQDELIELENTHQETEKKMKEKIAKLNEKYKKSLQESKENQMMNEKVVKKLTSEIFELRNELEKTSKAWLPF